MKNLFLAVSVLALAALPAMAAEATFKCAYPVNGRAELSVATKAGDLFLTRSVDHQIHVLGRVRYGWKISDKQALEIAMQPPIEQTGNIVRIGYSHENLRGVKIDYEIQTPDDTLLDASSGAGDITVDGVSGNLRITDGEGKVELRHLRGGLNVSVGTGNIKAEGTPSAGWQLKTGHGNIEILPGGARFTLDAATGAGIVRTARQVAGAASPDGRHVTGIVNGGGPTVHVETGAGDIRIH